MIERRGSAHVETSDGILVDNGVCASVTIRLVVSDSTHDVRSTPSPEC